MDMGDCNRNMFHIGIKTERIAPASSEYSRSRAAL